MPKRVLLVGTGLAVTVAVFVLSLAGVQPAALSQTAMSQGQTTSPLDELRLHLVGVHVVKEAPGRQYVAHHYCQQFSEQVTQCAVFDGGKPGARLIDIEYIIPGDTYRSLSSAEQQYWHPHTYEVDGGLLTAPELPPDQEQSVLAGVRDTYGRTWHLWAGKENPLPLGPPELVWSITGPGQLRQDTESELKQEQGR